MGRRRFINSIGSLPKDYILCYDFNGDLLDKSINSLHGIKTGNADFSNGRKSGTQCLLFTAGCVRTPSNLPVNSNKITLSFWMKSAQTSTAVLFEMSPTLMSNNAFNVINNNSSANSIQAAMRQTQIASSAMLFNFIEWNHFIIEFDRSKMNVSEKINFYVNGKKMPSVVISSFDNTGNFVNNILFIGQRNASSFPFVGYLQNLKIYNRGLSPAEIHGLKLELL
ncbi:LamG-like jellyroll fold domain-containing protein [Epilithonimonas xixisoli]|uniref:Concanavalin A-like lectin/glucanase superfamily protein n=1 Tax=Epilithonimonas xixisoli TaxID=1476462 RepID=A0A4R8I939_9FLAO|nr:LamG-like jellyroll fold domain-containing protein [Epilithonimonas xixisoli]TDX86164.1 concanavalin A-like lectin/glucanase superfamily protein [Epilithonimonas xixisoli]